MWFLGPLLMLFMSLTLPEDNALTIHFENIIDNRGTLLIGFYHDQKGWKARKPDFELVVSKTAWSNGRMTTTINNLTDGIYGIAVLDDTNDNQVVDMGFIFPLEGFGFSNYEHKSWLLPTFDDFDFSYPQNRSVRIKMRYLDLQ